ncbi:MAG TPA: tetratricopeptide repeat protein [Pseudomonadota bacterium]|nr:tetratricopeptide repeat protein [Pseudomonadota bacterium]
MLLARWLPSVVLLAFVLAGAAAAAAAENQPASNVSCDADPECSRMAYQASVQSQAGQFGEARRLYEAAYALRPAPILLYNLGRVMHKAGRPADAAGYYERYLAAGAEGSEINRRKTEQYLEQARREAGIAVPASQSALPGTTQQNPGSQPAAAIPTARPEKNAASNTDRPQPLYKKWWLWTVVGVAAVGIGVGIGVGLAARRPDLSGAVEVIPF